MKFFTARSANLSEYAKNVEKLHLLGSKTNIVNLMNLLEKILTSKNLMAD